MVLKTKTQVYDERKIETMAKLKELALKRAEKDDKNEIGRYYNYR